MGGLLPPRIGYFFSEVWVISKSMNGLICYLFVTKNMGQTEFLLLVTDKIYVEVYVVTRQSNWVSIHLHDTQHLIHMRFVKQSDRFKFSFFL